MNIDTIKNIITAQYPDAAIEQGKQFPEVTVKPASLLGIAQLLKDAPELMFDYMSCLSGIDYPNHFSIFYHFESLKNRTMIVLKVVIEDKVTPVVESLANLWPTAEFHEREVYDLLGIRFNNHPDLRRLFLDETAITGFPLRKDYKDEINIIER